jgi:hypothetical protein
MACRSWVQDLAPEPNQLQTDAWEYEIDPETNYQGVIISELLAANQSGLLDDDRARVDWIELHNTNDFEVDLSGWSLSDDPMIQGNGCLMDLPWLLMNTKLSSHLQRTD